jgi:hypothetical protein
VLLNCFQGLLTADSKQVNCLPMPEWLPGHNLGC